MTSAISEITRQAEALLSSHGLIEDARLVRASLPVASTLVAAYESIEAIECRLVLANTLAAYQLHELMHEPLTGTRAMDYLPWLEHRRNNPGHQPANTTLIRPSGMGDRSQMRNALSTMLQKLSIDTERAQLTGTFEETFVPKVDCHPPR